LKYQIITVEQQKLKQLTRLNQKLICIVFISLYILKTQVVIFDLSFKYFIWYALLRPITM